MIKKTLIVDMIDAPDGWQKVFQENGIRYEQWVAQPIADQVRVMGCTNVPDRLPGWVREVAA